MNILIIKTKSQPLTPFNKIIRINKKFNTRLTILVNKYANGSDNGNIATMNLSR